MKKIKRLSVMFVALCMVLSFVMPAYAVESFEVQGASAISTKTIEVQFNADVDQTLAVNVGNYAVRETYGAQTVFPVASASMKLDDSGNVIGNTVILKLASATAINIYTVTVSNVTASDGTLLAADKNSWTFAGTNLNTPEEQDTTLHTLAVSEFIVTGSNTVYANWNELDVDVPQTGVIGYEIYYMKKVDLGNNALTKDTTGATKVAVDWASTQYTQLNIDGDAKDYKFVIYAVNGRTYSMPSYSATYRFGIQSVLAVNNKTIEVQFNADVDQTLAVNVVNYVVSEEYQTQSVVPVARAYMKTNVTGNIIGNTVILKLASAINYELYRVTVANITDFDGTPLASSLNSYMFVGNDMNSEDMELQNSSVSGFNVSGSDMVNATWTPFNSNQISDTGVIGYEIYYMKRADIGFQTLTKATLGTAKVVIQGASTSSVQINLAGNISDYAFVIYAVNGRVYSLPKYFPNSSFAIQSATAINNKTVEVKFSADVDTTSITNVANYKVQEAYGAKIVLPVASASMKLDAGGNVVSNTVVLKLSTATKLALYRLFIVNVLATDGAPLALDKSECTFIGNVLSPPEDQDAALQASRVSGFIVNGSGTVNATWVALNSYSQTGITGYEIYYIKKADLGSQALTKNTIGATKLTVAGESTSFVQLNLDGSSQEYAIVIYAVNGRTYSQPAYAQSYSFEVQSAYSPYYKTIEVKFNANVDPTSITNVANYTIDAGIPVVNASIKLDSSGNVIGNTVVLNLGSGTTPGRIYRLTVLNVMGFDSTPLTVGRNSTTFVGGMIPPQEQDAALQTYIVSGLTASGSGTVKVTWNTLSSDQINQSGTKGYEIYYIKRADLGLQAFTKDTLGAVKVAINGALKYSVQISLQGDAADYIFVIYAVNGRVYSLPKCFPDLSLAVQSAIAINNKTIEVQFSSAINQILAVNVANYNVQEAYGAKTILPIASASMKLDSSGNVVANTVVLKLSSATKSSTLYGLNVINVTALDGTPLGVDKSRCTFVGSGLNTPEEQDAILPTLKVSGLAVSGSGAVEVTWTAFDLNLMPQAGVTGYEIYYIKKADLTKKVEKEKQKIKEKKMDFFTKDTLGATKVAVDGVLTSSTQLNLEGSTTDDYMFTIYAVNGRVCSMRATLSVLEPKVQSVVAVDNSTINVVFDMAVDITEAVFTVNEKYGAKSGLDVTGVSISKDGKTVIIKTAPQKSSTLYGINGGGFKSDKGNYGDNFSMAFVGIG